MDIFLEKASELDAESIFDIQIAAFTPLLKKYRDYETNPANETIDRVIARINNPDGGFYKIMANQVLAGAICMFRRDEAHYWISPMFIRPENQGKGIAQQAIFLLEQAFPQAKTWELATILEEERNCHLYRKMGYSETGIRKTINEFTTLVYYKKVVHNVI
ncbi:GNAT family N-acetyltransferase [Cohnella terricola]|uniref:GNAT family N-acetyltransferase n=1 Tax=Cohnella terricola TaxID=1289167 RepID=A0A559J8W2_9BACL|nr:GNAT family N-acetyltransferase [Cohnella terricola]TVX96325.1 GNAT family N-acetyltransferase [Cohnella terricola]